MKVHLLRHRFPRLSREAARSPQASAGVPAFVLGSSTSFAHCLRRQRTHPHPERSQDRASRERSPHKERHRWSRCSVLRSRSAPRPMRLQLSRCHLFATRRELPPREGAVAREGVRFQSLRTDAMRSASCVSCATKPVQERRGEASVV
eukprot:scaffold298742_cov33-Tisochrysis_lutea.AAC.4